VTTTLPLFSLLELVVYMAAAFVAGVFLGASGPRWRR